MAVQNSSTSVLNINYPENGKNKVYVNPNFNRPQTYNLASSAIMHVNPKFSHLVPNVQCNTQNKNKIYVNPNFIKCKRVCDSSQSNAVHNDIVSERHSASDSIVTCNQQSVENHVSPHQVPITQTRYCLVRQNITNILLDETSRVPARPKNTFNVNKYKSVPWTDVKKNLDIVKSVVNINSSLSFRIKTNSNSNITKNNCRSSVVNGCKNEFKYINYNNISLIKQEEIKTKICEESKVNKLNQMNLSRVKKTKGNLKKNNVPCPLFRKYGKCLRNVRGKCAFLHDKKHVSICRKFVKGLCHDKECLLSHDLTTKKMPTCYFYLQGTCTKTDCPYLHVKLNEKTKICPDFLKGYCEKGSKCLQRHINVSTEKKNMRNSHGKKASYSNNYNELKESKVNNFDIQAKPEFQSTKINNENNCKSFEIKSENYFDCRYYQEHQDGDNTNEFCEVIKPMRCKLGTLPSFIQL